MVHNAFNFVKDLIVHMDFLLHGDSPRFNG